MNVLEKIFNFMKHLPSNFVVLLVKFYRKFISPLTPPSCRYIPTCSEYAIIALQRYGFFKGSYLTIKRIGRCHPFHEGGYDPVP